MFQWISAEKNVLFSFQSINQSINGKSHYSAYNHNTQLYIRFILLHLRILVEFQLFSVPSLMQSNCTVRLLSPLKISIPMPCLPMWAFVIYFIIPLAWPSCLLLVPYLTHIVTIVAANCCHELPSVMENGKETAIFVRLYTSPTA